MKGYYYKVAFFLIYLLMCFKSYSQEADFSYRDPYFLEINTPLFSEEFNTHRLDDEWGIWGHNLPKIIKGEKYTDKIYALVDGVRDDQQFCFSSVELENLIIKKIKTSDKKNYVIAPNDNLLSCQCSKCKEVGNTTKNSSPAVFTMLNKLAKKNTDLNFYTLVYPPVIELPNFKIKKNVGVFFSTINYQKGIAYEDQKGFKKLKKELLAWKKNVNNIIIWDYVLNFDNYHDFYPILSIVQKNLVFFKSINIHGVFFNGSETYTVFQDLKTTILSKLLINVSLNLQNEITQFFKNKYPEKIANLLTSFYLTIENEFIASKKEQGIYSTIFKAKEKYLKEEKFIMFYEELKKAVKELDAPSENIKKIILSATFLKLELIRANGINSIKRSSRKDVSKMLTLLKKIAKETKIFYVNERKSTLKEYVFLWQKELIKPVYKNKLKIDNLTVKSELDEDYKDVSMLIDNKNGFLDYGVNWFITSKNDFIFEINKDIEKGDELLLNFLNDPKHHIYHPKKITVTINKKENKKLEKIIENKSEVETQKVLLTFDRAYKNSSIVITIKRRFNKYRSAIACDEIILKNK